MLDQLVLPETDMSFSLDHAISMVKHQLDSKLMLPFQAAQVQPGKPTPNMISIIRII